MHGQNNKMILVHSLMIGLDNREKEMIGSVEEHGICTCQVLWNHLLDTFINCMKAVT